MENKDISEYSTEELKVIAFDAYQNREMANNQISQSNRVITQVNQKAIDDAMVDYEEKEFIVKI